MIRLGTMCTVKMKSKYTCKRESRFFTQFPPCSGRQSFYSPSPGPMLSNCFMETFSEWMERPCKAGLTGEDRAPCCQASRDH